MSTVLNYRAAIETFNLSKRFGSTLAVGNLSLTLPEGEMFALVGPDGAGKTTTLRLLCEILEPTSGKARILGRDLKGESAWIKAHIGC